MKTLLVCRKCFKGVGKKDGWKRAAIKEQMEIIAADRGLEIVMSGCLDICPDKGVTIGVAPSKKSPPEATCVLKPQDDHDAARERASQAFGPIPAHPD